MIRDTPMTTSSARNFSPFVKTRHHFTVRLEVHIDIFIILKTKFFSRFKLSHRHDLLHCLIWLSLATSITPATAGGLLKLM